MELRVRLDDHGQRAGCPPAVGLSRRRDAVRLDRRRTGPRYPARRRGIVLSSPAPGRRRTPKRPRNPGNPARNSNPQCVRSCHYGMWSGGGFWCSQRCTLAMEIWSRALGFMPSWSWALTWCPSCGIRTGDAAHAEGRAGTAARRSPGATGHARRVAGHRGTAGGASRLPAVTGRPGRNGPPPEPGSGRRALVRTGARLVLPHSLARVGDPGAVGHPWRVARMRLTDRQWIS